MHIARSLIPCGPLATFLLISLVFKKVYESMDQSMRPMCTESKCLGGIIPSMDIEIVKLLKYNDSSDYILMAVEVLFGLFVLYYLIEEGIEIKTHGMGYFMNMGNSFIVITLKCLCARPCFIIKSNFDAKF